MTYVSNLVQFLMSPYSSSWIVRVAKYHHFTSFYSFIENLEVDVELGGDEDITPGEFVYDEGADDAGNLFDFDDDL